MCKIDDNDTKHYKSKLLKQIHFGIAFIHFISKRTGCAIHNQQRSYSKQQQQYPRYIYRLSFFSTNLRPRPEAGGISENGLSKNVLMFMLCYISIILYEIEINVVF